MTRLYIILPLLFLSLSVAQAETPPKPAKKVISSQNFKDQLVKQENKKADLKKKMDALNEELSETKKKLVRVAKSIQGNEKELQNIDRRTNALENEKSELQSKLKKDRIAISRLLTALERIRRVPPEALIARPDAPLKTAQSAMLLGDIIPTLNQKAQNLKNDLARQQSISVELAQQKETALEKSAALKEEQKNINALLIQREALYKKTQKDYKVREVEIQKISRASRNLKDLVNRLNKDKQRKKTKNNIKKAVLKAPAVSMPPPGSARLPVSGIIKTRYHDLDKFGAKSEGLRIEGSSSGLVVAPMAGIVRFAGPFKNYDNMVIIEHKDGYHSLIGGLSRIQTRVDQSVSAGEPLGKLKSTTNNAQPVLYYELRFKGRAVNPSKKFSNLG